MKSILFVILLFLTNNYFDKDVMSSNHIIKHYEKPKLTSIGKNILVSLPENSDSCETLIIWGGWYYADKNFMYNSIPEKLKYNYRIICTNWNVTFSELKNKTKEILSLDNKNKISILGFSAGACQVETIYSKDWKLVGLIDPSLYSSFLKKTLDSNISMIYNPYNWGKERNYLNLIHNKIKNSNGESIKINLPHSKIPKYFFETILIK